MQNCSCNRNTKYHRYFEFLSEDLHKTCLPSEKSFDFSHGRQVLCKSSFPTWSLAIHMIEYVKNTFASWCITSEKRFELWRKEEKQFGKKVWRAADEGAFRNRGFSSRESSNSQNYVRTCCHVLFVLLIIHVRRSSKRMAMLGFSSCQSNQIIDFIWLLFSHTRLQPTKIYNLKTFLKCLLIQTPAIVVLVLLYPQSRKI